MKNEIIATMEKEINMEINYALAEFNSNGQTEYYWKLYNRINGMCEMLGIVAGKHVCWDENGVKYEF